MINAEKIIGDVPGKQTKTWAEFAQSTSNHGVKYIFDEKTDGEGRSELSGVYSLLVTERTTLL